MRESLTPEQQAELDECMDTDAMTGAAIAKAIGTEWGITIQPSTVQRHRRGECSCGRTA